MTIAAAGRTAARPPAERLAGLDALRVVTLACIVAYHCLGSVAARTPSGLGLEGEWAAWVLSVFQNEVLVALSAYLFSWRRRDLRRTLIWLAEVYMFWTAVYLVESIFFVARATVSPFGWAEFVFVLFFGGAKYHLPFFPALAGCLAVIASAPSVGSPRLWGGVAIIAAVARRSLEQGVLQSGVLGPAEMLLFQSMAFASFLPFAMLGARIQAISARGTALGANMDSVGFFLFASVLIATGLRQAAVDSSTATEVLMAGRMAAIVTVLLVALGPGADFAPSSPRLRLLLARLAALSLTVFLVHPLVIDILAPSLLPRAVPSVRVALLLLCVLGISFAFAHVASKVLRTAGWRRSRQFGVSVPLL